MQPCESKSRPVFRPIRASIPTIASADFNENNDVLGKFYLHYEKLEGLCFFCKWIGHTLYARLPTDNELFPCSSTDVPDVIAREKL